MREPGSSYHPEDCQANFAGLLPVATPTVPGVPHQEQAVLQQQTTTTMAQPQMDNLEPHPSGSARPQVDDPPRAVHLHLMLIISEKKHLRQPTLPAGATCPR